MPNVPMTNVNAYYSNTSPGNTILSNVIDAAIQDIVQAINDNWAIYDAFVTNVTLPIPDQSIVERHIRNLAITNPKLAPSAVTNDKISDGTITAAKLADLLITTSKLADLSVTNGKLVALAVTGDKIANSTITTDKLQDLLITTVKLAPQSVTEPKLGTSSVSSRVLAPQSVTASKLDPSLINPISDAGIQYEFGLVDAQFADIVEVNVKNFGAIGNGSTDDTSAIIAAKNYAIQNLPCKLTIPKGVYLYTDLGDFAYEGLTVNGSGDKSTILRCISTIPNHNAIILDAFRFGTTSDQFVFRCNWKDIQVQGNVNTANIFFLQGVAMGNWENVTGAIAKPADGKMLNLRSVHLFTFKNVSISANLNNVTLPYYGLYVDEGSRGGNIAGNSTNNTFINCYFESVAQGGALVKADQNTFIGGAMEGCSNIGLKIESACKWNKFIGVGFEKNASKIEVIDNGRLTQFDACYFEFTIQLTGSQSKINGCSAGSINVSGPNNRVEDVRVNYHGANDGGFINTGDNTIFSNVLDLFTGQYAKVVLGNRVAITVGASPFTWTNNNNYYVEVIMQSGTLSQVQGRRPGSSDWILPNTAPNKYLVAPGDSLIFTYSVAPSISSLPLNTLK